MFFCPQIGAQGSWLQRTAPQDWRWRVGMEWRWAGRGERGRQGRSGRFTGKRCFVFLQCVDVSISCLLMSLFVFLVTKSKGGCHDKCGGENLFTIPKTVILIWLRTEFCVCLHWRFLQETRQVSCSRRPQGSPKLHTVQMKPPQYQFPLQANR